jgi:hypothetical protein
MTDNYDKFVEELHRKYPTMFSGQYGGVCVGEGWWPIIDSLCSQIQSHLKHRNGLATQYPDQHEPVKEVVIDQIKEKFGGLRFYYEGGDDTIHGMVRMAESWASHSCESCGNVGKRVGGGWVRTLCDFHIVEQEALRAEQMKKDGYEE